MVNIVHQGVYYHARALIDPAYEPLQSNFRIALIFRCPISATSRKMCTLKIGHYNYFGNIYLGFIVNFLKSIPFSSHFGFQSTDSRLEICGHSLVRFSPVDILLGADLFISKNFKKWLSSDSIFELFVTGPIPDSEVRTFALLYPFEIFGIGKYSKKEIVIPLRPFL